MEMSQQCCPRLWLSSSWPTPQHTALNRGGLQHQKYKIQYQTHTELYDLSRLLEIRQKTGLVIFTISNLLLLLLLPVYCIVNSFSFILFVKFSSIMKISFYINFIFSISYFVYISVIISQVTNYSLILGRNFSDNL